MYIFKAKQNNCVHLTHGLKHSDTQMLHELHTAAYYCVGPRSIQGSHAHNSLQRASGITSITLPGYPETWDLHLSYLLMWQMHFLFSSSKLHSSVLTKFLFACLLWLSKRAHSEPLSCESHLDFKLSVDLIIDWLKDSKVQGSQTHVI